MIECLRTAFLSRLKVRGLITRARAPMDPARLLVQIQLDGPTLATELEVTNTGGDAFDFQTALHSYFRCSDINKARQKISVSIEWNIIAQFGPVGIIILELLV